MTSAPIGGFHSISDASYLHRSPNTDQKSRVSMGETAEAFMIYRCCTQIGVQIANPVALDLLRYDQIVEGDERYSK